MIDKVQKIREEVARMMYGYNLEADIASCENAESEKLADIKYQLCKKILELIDSLQEEPVSEDLDEASEEFCKSTLVGSPYIKKNAFKTGAKWQKEQLMAKAKSGTVQKDNQVILDNGTYIDLDSSMQLKPSFVGLKEGDRIKVIVIKESKL